MAISQAIRYKVLKRDGFCCVLCGKSGKESELEIDHIVPKADGGRDIIANLRTACADCNRGRGADIPEPREEMRKSPMSPQNLPLPWFGAEHGLDNYEDILRLDEIQSARAVWQLIGHSDVWDICCHIRFKNRDRIEIHLSERGYHAFVTSLKQIK